MAEGFGKGQLIGQCKQPRVWQIDHKSWRLFALFCTDELVRPVNAVDLKSPRSKSPSSRREENRRGAFKPVLWGPRLHGKISGASGGS